MNKQSPQTSSINLFPVFEINSLLLYSAITKSFSSFISTPFENIRSSAQADPKNYQGMLRTSKELGIYGSFKGASLNLSLAVIKQCGYRNMLMDLSSKHNLSATQSAFLLTFGDSLIAQPLLRIRTNYITSKKNSLYETTFKEKKAKHFISFLSKGFSTKFTNDLLGWSVFYHFDPFIKEYARNNSTTNSGYYGLVFGGYALAGSATEIALAPLKFCLTQIHRYDQPIASANPAQLLKNAFKTHKSFIFRGSVPSLCSAATKLFTTSLIQERINKKYDTSIKK